MVFYTFLKTTKIYLFYFKNINKNEKHVSSEDWHKKVINIVVRRLTPLEIGFLFFWSVLGILGNVVRIFGDILLDNLGKEVPDGGVVTCLLVVVENEWMNEYLFS